MALGLPLSRQDAQGRPLFQKIRLKSPRLQLLNAPRQCRRQRCRHLPRSRSSHLRRRSRPRRRRLSAEPHRIEVANCVTSSTRSFCHQANMSPFVPTAPTANAFSHVWRSRQSFRYARRAELAICMGASLHIGRPRRPRLRNSVESHLFTLLRSYSARLQGVSGIHRATDRSHADRLPAVPRPVLGPAHGPLGGLLLPGRSVVSSPAWLFLLLSWIKAARVCWRKQDQHP